MLHKALLSGWVMSRCARNSVFGNVGAISTMSFVVSRPVRLETFRIQQGSNYVAQGSGFDSRGRESRSRGVLQRTHGSQGVLNCCCMVISQEREPIN